MLHLCQHFYVHLFNCINSASNRKLGIRNNTLDIAIDLDEKLISQLFTYSKSHLFIIRQNLIQNLIYIFYIQTMDRFLIFCRTLYIHIYNVYIAVLVANTNVQHDLCSHHTHRITNILVHIGNKTLLRLDERTVQHLLMSFSPHTIPL